MDQFESELRQVPGIWDGRYRMAANGVLFGPNRPLVAMSRARAWSHARTLWNRLGRPRAYVPLLVCPYFDDPSRTGAIWIKVSSLGGRHALNEISQLPLAGDPESGWYGLVTCDFVHHLFHGPTVAAWMFKAADR